MLFKNYKSDLSPLIFAIFAVIGGFLEAFTFFLHGGVFCNAQTGNVVMLVIKFVSGDFASGVKYLYSIIAYVAGITLSTLIPSRFAKVNWPFIVAGVELIAFAALAFIPSSASDWYTYVTVSFLCSVQYNTFTKLRGVALATTFCTNNIRQTVIHLVGAASSKSVEECKKAAVYAFIIICFCAGVGVGVVSSQHLGNYSILICVAMLLPVIALFSADCALAPKNRAKSEKDTDGGLKQLSIDDISGFEENNYIKDINSEKKTEQQKK